MGTTNKFRFIRTSFILLLFFSFIILSVQAEDNPCVWTGVKRIIAVGDIHGDYDNFVTILQKTGILSEKLHWIAEQTHFVQTGDIMDRGPHAKKAFDLMMRMEKEAQEAGGMVHFLIGNHEEMNITGISLDQPGYVSPEQFVSFLPDKYIEKKERDFLKDNQGSFSDQNESLKQYWYYLMNNDIQSKRKYVENFNEIYGDWILKHNAVIKINGIIFVHGGISKKFSKWKLTQINERTKYELYTLQRAYLRNLTPKINLEIVFQSDGPFWYRELARQDEKLFKKEVDLIFENLDARAMVIAHTPRTGIVASAENMSRFDGRVWIIDTGISEAYGGILSALIIENENFIIWGEDHEKK
jgi:hypothetical protein